MEVTDGDGAPGARAVARVDDGPVDDDVDSLMAGMGTRLALPLVVRDRTIGTLFLGRRGAREYDERDRVLAEGLAQRGAVAIDNARLCEQLRTQSRLKDEFLATVSHELRTPLTAILGWARLLPRRQPADRRELAPRRSRSSSGTRVAQAQLIEDILDVSRIITGNLRLEIRSLDLAEVVRTALDAVRPAAEAKDIDVRATLDPAAARVTGDPDRLQQIVWNLLTNAIKFTPKGGRIARRAASGSRPTSSSRCPTPGPGIAPDFLPCVFDRFRQADGARPARHGGLGLGLAIVRHLAEAPRRHGPRRERRGRAGARRSSSPCRSARSTRAVVAEAAIDRAAGGPRVSHLSLAGVTVLVVDDEADARHLVETTLSAHGAGVRTAASGATGAGAAVRAT